MELQLMNFINSLILMKNNDSIIWEGICSHLAASDAEDKSFALHQIEIFKQMIELAKSRGINFKYKHIANSGAIASIPQSHFNLVVPEFRFTDLHQDLNMPKN